jgi:hypothetical protein
MIPPERASVAGGMVRDAGGILANVIWFTLLLITVALAFLWFGRIALLGLLLLVLFVPFARRTKMCPQCGERVKYAAKVCRFCRAKL